MVNARFKVTQEGATVPIHGNNDNKNAGIDLISCQEVLIPSKESRLVNLGVAWSPIFDSSNYKNIFIKLYIKLVSLTHKIEMHIRSRSGLAVKHGIEVGAGTIDESYRGELKVLLTNNSNESYKVGIGDRIAQGVIDCKPLVSITTIKELDETNRGKKGFGSTGR